MLHTVSRLVGELTYLPGFSVGLAPLELHREALQYFVRWPLSTYQPCVELRGGCVSYCERLVVVPDFGRLFV